MFGVPRSKGARRGSGPRTGGVRQNRLAAPGSRRTAETRETPVAARPGVTTGGVAEPRNPTVPTPRGRPHLAPWPPRAPGPYLSSLAVITPSSLGMSSAAVTASWWPSILLSSTGRLLCGLEWISAAMFAPRPPPRAAHQLTAGRGRAGCWGQPGRVCATPP